MSKIQDAITDSLVPNKLLSQNLKILLTMTNVNINPHN